MIKRNTHRPSSGPTTKAKTNPPAGANLNDMEVLRKDCKSLLSSLQKHQDALNESLNKYKSNSKTKLSVSKKQNSFSSSSVNMAQSTAAAAAKTVSFSHHLRTSDTNSQPSTPRRRSRSVSPFTKGLKKNPAKSILKKQIVQDVLSDIDDECERRLFRAGSVPDTMNHSIASSSGLSSPRSESTGSLLACDIYGHGKYENEVRSEFIKYKSLNPGNVDSFIDYLEKQRQAYLNYHYSFENLNDDSPDKTSKSPGKTSKLTKSATLKKEISYDKPTQSSLNMAKCNLNTKAKVAANKTQIQKKKKNYKKMAKNAKKNRPLLGLDWALDAIDTEMNTTKSKYDRPEEYWNELSQFRDQNKLDCMSANRAFFDGTINSLFETTLNETRLREQPDDDEVTNHKCIHSYTLNERLFPVPVCKNKLGQSICPVCKSTRKESTSYEPQFYKISIPKSKVAESMKIQPVIKSKMNEQKVEDTLSLSQNCVAGLQHAPKKSSNTYAGQTFKTIDLKTYANMKDSFNKLTLDDLKRISTNKDPATATIYNKAHAMRYELEDNHLRRLREFMPTK